MKKRPIVLVLLFISLALAAALLQAQSTPEATSLPTATYTPPYSYVLGESVYVRGGPGEFYTPVGQLIAGAFVKPLSRNAAGDWVLIAYYDNYGWIRRDLASWVEDIDALPVIDESNLTPSPVSTNELGTPFVPPTDTPVGNWIRADELGALVRAGPGRTYLRLGQLHTGDLVEPVGRNEDISWIMIRYGEGFGWIAWELAYWQANLDSLPVVSPDNLTPTPTYTDTSTPTNTTTPSPTDTATATASASETPVPADTPTDTATTPPSDTPTGTATSSATPTDTPTETATVIPSVTVTDTPVPSETPVPTDTATNSPIPTETPIPTDTPTETPLPTEIPSATATETATSTAVPTDTPVPSDTPSATALPSETAAQVVVIVPTLTDTALPTYTSVPSSTPTSSATPTYTETSTPAPSDTTVPVNTPTDTATVTSTASGTPAPLPSATAAVSTTSAATQESTATATETASDTAVPVVANRPTDVLAPAATIPPASAPRFPIEAVVGGVGLLLVIGYVGLYWRGQTATERYSGGFVIGECPVCHRGHLTVKSKREPLAGIPRVRRTVRCSACRSVLRETGYRRWRYAIDPLENSALYERYNGRELDEETLKRLAQEPPSNEPPRPRPPTKPPKFLDEGD